MYQLVNDDVLDDAGWEQDDVPVEVELVGCTALAPAAAVILRDHPRGLVADTFLGSLDTFGDPTVDVGRVPGGHVVTTEFRLAAAGGAKPNRRANKICFIG